MAENPRTSLTDTPLYRMTSSISRWFAVSMLRILCSLPIVTMGAATAAAMETSLNPEGVSPQGLVKGYFGSFRKHFSRATGLWLLTLAALTLLALDAVFYRQMMTGLPWLLPAAWVHRLIKTRATWHQHTEEMQNILTADKDEVRKIQQLHERLGL